MVPPESLSEQSPRCLIARAPCHDASAAYVRRDTQWNTFKSGLYSRAVALGGTSFLPASSDDPNHPFFDPNLRAGESQGTKLFQSLGVNDLQSARELDSHTLLKATEGWPPKFVVIRDGDLVQAPTPRSFAQGKFNDTPLIIGYTSDETGEPPPEVTRAAVMADMEKAPCKHTHAALFAAYPLPPDDAGTRAVVRRVSRDQGIGRSVWQWAQAQHTHGRSDVYVYFFDRHRPDQPHGAPHATEYPYVFGNFPQEATPEDHEASAMIRRYLVNFAASGNPNGEGLPVWTRFEPKSARVMVLDQTPSSREWPSLTGVKAFDRYFECFTQLPVGEMTPPP